MSFSEDALILIRFHFFTYCSTPKRRKVEKILCLEDALILILFHFVTYCSTPIKKEGRENFMFRRCSDFDTFSFFFHLL